MLKIVERGLYKGCQVVTSIALLAMVVLTVGEIFVRQIMGSSLLIVDEVSGYLMVVLAYWGAVNAFSDGEFVRVDAIFDRLSAKTKNVLNFVFTILFSVVNGLVFWFAWQNTASTLSRWDLSATVARLPLAYPKLAMSVGLFLLELVLIIRIIEFILPKRTDEEGL